MSFTAEIRDELIRIQENSTHCRTAALAAILDFSGRTGFAPEGKMRLLLPEAHDEIVTKCFTLLKKTLNIGSTLNLEDSIVIQNQTMVSLLLDASRTDRLLELLKTDREQLPEVSPESGIFDRDCCRKTFLRHAFLCTGFISDPGREYHLEFDCSRQQQAVLLQELFEPYGIRMKTIMRRRHYMVYSKDSEEILNALTLMGASAGMMKMENSRILKEVRNGVNRRVNCETANIGKTVEAAGRQREDIEFLRESGILEQLPAYLIEAARLRLENEELSIAELGKLAEPPVGKSGMNHRLRKLSEIAQLSRS